ncbi:tpr [Trichoderma arundinaceum]|uniref:Protein ZIP4 homolog n=1 Tax=Trichoderma arundinaceum TaxID=490622 RepID=A0A395NMF4_TRIAR|nr:tpr [Trichoderma arundinaceum]
MATEDFASAGRIRKARSFIDFAIALQAKLADPLEARTIDLLLADTGHHIQLIHNVAQSGSSAPLPSRLAKDVERQGRDLWNLCVKLKREQDASFPTEKAKLLVKARSFAFNMLELGRSAGGAKKDDISETVYITNLALTLGKLCIRDSDLDSARLALQKAAELLERLKEIPPNSSSDHSGQNERSKLDAEYLAMRTALSWKEDRLDVAEHMFGKIDALRPTLYSSSAEIIASTLQNIGSDLASKRDHDMAVKWLKRAYSILNYHALDHLSARGLELRQAICQGLVQGLLDIGSPTCVQEANDLIEYVASEIGDKPIVLHWRLEVLRKTPGETFDIEAYSSILSRMVRSFDYSEDSFYFLLDHIKSLREKSPRLACGLSDQLLLQHIVSSKKNEWIGKIIVRRIWMSTLDDTNLVEALADLHTLLDKAYDGLSKPLESDIAGAAHMKVIWNKMDSFLFDKAYGVAEAWCLIASHRIFMSSGEANHGKFSRKHISCALGVKDTEKARRILNSMPENAKSHILTRYLAFRVSLIDWDHELGFESIRHLSKLSDSSQGRDVLYACIREAQQVGDKLYTAAEHANQGAQDDEGNRIFTIPELHWFRKNAYNMGVSRCDTWKLSHTIRVFKTCLAFSGCYPNDIPVTEVAEIAVMAMRCHFVIASALVSLARVEDLMEEQLQHYLEARHHIGEFHALLETDIKGIQEETITADLTAKLSTLFVFDFEAAIMLKGWDGLNEIVRRAKICRDEVIYKAMGDCMLRSRAPGKVMFSTMRLIINEIFELENFDYEKLAKYIRCMFQAILGLDDASALQLVDQAIQIAREGKESGNQLPSAEVEWLVVTTFNHAVDYYARGDEEPCHRWALKAMDLAEYFDDGGVLRDMLQAKFAKLQFDGRPGRDVATF